MNLCVKSLKKWAEEQQLLKKTVKNFWTFFSEYKLSEEYETYFGKHEDDTLITFVLPSITIIRQVENKFDYCVVTLHVDYRNKFWGYYKNFFTLDGEYYDCDYKLDVMLGFAKQEEVTIKYTGDRLKDFNAAKKAAGYKKTPEGSNWYYQQDGRTMKLISKIIHDQNKSY
jgi:hypothetical protein